jgi:vitamin B12 transporter
LAIGFQQSDFKEKDMSKFLLALAAAMVVAFSAPAGAQTGIEEERSETGPDLDTIVISTSRIPESLREVSQHVQVITDADIERSGADDIVDLLKKLGVRTFMEGSDTYGNNGIAMRGGRTSMHGFDLGGDILVLVDGRRSASDFGSEFNLGNVERIEVLHGPGAVQFGSSAIAGVINIITRRGGEVPKARLEAGIGSWGEQKYAAGGSGRIGNFDLSGGISHRTRGNFSHADGTVEDNSDLGARINYNANVGYNFNTGHRVGLVFHGSKTDDAGKGTSESSTSYRMTRQDRNSYAFDLLYEGGNESRTMGWLVRYFQGQTDYEINRFNYTGTSPGRKIYSISRNDFSGAQGQFDWRLGRLQLVTGVDWLKYDYEQIQRVSSPTEATSGIENIGAFLLAKYHLLSDESLVLSAGLRYDEFDIQVAAHTASAGGFFRNVSSSLDKLNPSFGITYSPVEFLKLRANYGAAYKIPLPRQLGGYTYMSPGTPFVGDPDLKPEESRNLEFGFDLDYRGLFVTATYFDTKFKNMIDYYTVVRNTPGWIPGITNNNYYLYYNVDKVTVKGIDFGASFDIGEFFNLDFRLEPYVYWTRFFKYHYSHSARGFEGRELPERGRDSASFGIEFAYPAFKLSASLDGQRLGSMFSGSYISTSTPGVRLGGATIWSLSVRKAVFSTESYGDVYIKALVRNMFNEEYRTTQDDVMPGRSFYLALEYNY